MKVYGDGGGMYAQVFGKSEQPIYQPQEEKEPNSEYHGTPTSATLSEDKRCNCPKCKQAHEDYIERRREYRRSIKALRIKR